MTARERSPGIEIRDISRLLDRLNVKKSFSSFIFLLRIVWNPLGIANFFVNRAMLCSMRLRVRGSMPLVSIRLTGR